MPTATAIVASVPQSAATAVRRIDLSRDQGAPWTLLSSHARHRVQSNGRVTPTRILLLVIGAALASCGPSASPHPRVADALPHAPSTVRCGTAWDAQSGSIVDARIVFDGDRIAAFGPATAVPPRGEELDLRPLFCLPGLVDAHTHLTSYAHERATDSMGVRRSEATRNAALTLRAGVTTVRDLGGTEGVDMWLRDRIAAGAIPGPRMQCAGSQIGTSGPVGGVAGAKAAVDAHVDAGFDVIKLFATGGPNDPVPLLTSPEIAAATSEAHARGRRVAVHVVTAEGIDESIAAHVDSIEHGQELTVDQAAVMAREGITLVPTLYILRYYIEDANHLGFTDDYVADLRHLVDTIVVPFEARFPRILATGVKVAMGSDAFMGLHGRNVREIEQMVAAGMPPDGALRAATATAADLLGWNGKVGTLEPGAFADVIAVADDPRKDDKTLENVEVVITGGRVFADDRHQAALGLR
jgi:imidazolonepropionase-like amidohydrolase